MYAREGLPFLLEVGMEVVFVPPVLRVPRQGRVTHIAHQKEDAYLVQFDTIDSIDLAEKLQDHFCLVREERLPEGYDRMLFDLTGFRVSDPARGFTGDIVSMEPNPAHPLLVVEVASLDAEEQAGSLSRTVRIPLVEEFIVSIDEEGKTVMMELPEGLLDL